MEKTDKLISNHERIKKEMLKETEKIAKQLLKDIGIKLHLLGFEYWVKAIVITIDIEIHNRQKLRMMELYYMIAKECNTTPSRAERAMRHAFQEIDVNKYFKVAYKINNTDLLFLLKDTVLEKLKNIP